MENLFWACDKTHPLFLFVFNSELAKVPKEAVKGLRKDLKYMGFLVVGQLEPRWPVGAPRFWQVQSGGSGRW